MAEIKHLYVVVLDNKQRPQLIMSLCHKNNGKQEKYLKQNSRVLKESEFFACLYVSCSNIFTWVNAY